MDEQCCNRPYTCVAPCPAGLQQIEEDLTHYLSLPDACTRCGEPIEEEEPEFLVTATVQIVVPARDRVKARLLVIGVLQEFIECSPLGMDPLAGLTIDDVEDLTHGER